MATLTHKIMYISAPMHLYNPYQVIWNYDKFHFLCSISIITLLLVWNLVDMNWYSKCHEISLHWRHNDHNDVSNHQPHGSLLNCLYRCRSKKTSKLRVTGLCVGKSPGSVNSPQKSQLRGKCFHLMTSSWLLAIFQWWSTKMTWNHSNTERLGNNV